MPPDDQETVTSIHIVSDEPSRQLDSNRVGCAGISVGSYLTAYDQHTVAAMPRCFMAFYFLAIFASRNL
jgi:hypothetical protein